MVSKKHSTVLALRAVAVLMMLLHALGGTHAVPVAHATAALPQVALLGSETGDRLTDIVNGSPRPGTGCTRSLI